MATYKVELVVLEDESGTQTWGLAARHQRPGEKRVMDPGPASGLTLADAEHTRDMLERTGSIARIVPE